MPDGRNDPRPAAEGALALARQALREGQLRQAARHLAHAIAHAPTRPEVHETLSRLAARSDGGLDLFPLDTYPFIGTVVARAHLLAAAGHPDDGLDLLTVATSNAPTVGWADLPWVTAPELPARLDPQRIAQLLMRLCAILPDPVPESGRAPLRSYLTLAEHAVAAYPEHGLLLGAASALARRLGANSFAVDWAQRGASAWPTKLTEIWLGYAYRSAGQTGAALAALRRAIAHDPDDLAIYADLASTLADHGRLEEALGWIDRALDRDPSYDCAVHTAHRLRYRRDGALAHLVALADFQRDHPTDSHEHGDLAECCHGQPWLGHLPVDRTPVARPRQPHTDGAERQVPVPPGGSPPGRPRPAGPSPSSASAAERIRQVAQPVWPHPPAAYDQAVALATITPDDLLGLLVQPPASPPGPLGEALARHDPTVWERTVQVWACLGLLHHRTDEPWPQSARRGILLDLLAGGTDRVSEAALFALVTAAWVDPAVRPEVATLAAGRLAGAVRAGHRSPGTLAHLVLATPDLDPAVAELARGLLTSGRGGRPDPAGSTWRGRLRRWLHRLAKG